jgi:nitroimidazol reductase NimA-like FMN-containing flavoprotein (pyridoxamine 5'-phosphate oxidase superfamily)
MNIQQTHQLRGRLEELPVSECMELLTAKLVGRVGVSPSTGPQILPVNFVLHEGNILFRVAPFSRLAGLLDETLVAFEVDEIDDFLECGWSVLVVGRAHLVADLTGLPHMWAERPHPWASGGRDLYIRIDPTNITGRRVLPA